MDLDCEIPTGRWETLSARHYAVNRAHAKIRALVEQTMATLQTCEAGVPGTSDKAENPNA